MSRNNSGIGGLTLLGGAAVGAALMYLLDPENGEVRRRDAKVAANDVLSKAGTSLGVASASAADTIGSAGSTVADSAGSIWSSLAHKASELASSLSGHAQHATTAAGEAGASALDSARQAFSSFGRSAGSTASDAYDGARIKLGLKEEESSYAAPIAISAGTVAVLGLAAWYFMDPKNGKQRRERALGIANEVVQGTRDLARDAGARLGGGSRSQQASPIEYATSDDYMTSQLPAVAESALPPTGSSASAPTNVL